MKKTFGDLLLEIEKIKTQREFDTFISRYQKETKLTMKQVKRNMDVVDSQVLIRTFIENCKHFKP